jgi:serine/threonine protein kinase
MPQRLIQKKLKILSKPYLSLFSHEYEVGHILNSEYIARYFSYSAKEKSLYIEYIDGLTLSEFLATSEGREYFQGNDAYHHIHDFCVQVLSGMQQIHAHRLCHCDLKPNNIMIRQGSDHRAVLIDLGMAITQGLSLLIGTTESSKAPEMKLGQKCEINILCDIFMFGQVMQQVAASCPIYEPVCKLCTQQNPADRFQSVAQVLKSIEDIYSEKVNDDFNTILNLTDDTKQIRVEDSKIFYGDKFVGNINNLSFAHNNQTYLKLLIDRQQLQMATDNLLKQGEDNNDYLISLNKLSSIKIRINEYEENLLDIAKIIRKMRSGIDETLYNKVNTLFEAGDIQGAKKLINERDLRTARNSAHKHLEEVQKENERIMKIYYLRAKLTELDDYDDKRYYHADSDYKETISISNDINYDREETAEMLYDHALLQLHYNHVHRGIDIFRQSLKICKTLPKDNNITSNIANIKNNIALLDMQLGNYVRAEKSFNEALNIARVISESDQDNLIYVASTLDNLIHLHCILEKFDLAEKEVKEAIKIKKHLVTLDFSNYAEEYVITLTNAAAFHYTNSQYEKSEKESYEVLRICRKVVDKDKSIFKPYLAMSFTNLGVAHSNTGHSVKAEREMKSGIEIYRELATVNPDIYLSEVATNLNNLSSFYLDINKCDAALTTCNEALEIYTRLSEKEPQEYQSDIAWTLNTLASINYNLDNFVDAEKQYTKALKIYKQLLKKNSEAYKSDALLTITNLLQLYEDTHQKTKYNKLNAIHKSIIANKES